MITPILYKLSVLYLSALLSSGHAQSLPYNSARILLSTENSDVAYILQPSGTSSDFELLSLNISSTLTASDLAFSTISPNLPLLETDAFIPVINDKAEISVYAGNCSTSTASTLWIFAPDPASTNGNGTWIQGTTSTASDVVASDLPGADFLASGFSFSSLVGANASESDIYIFGGMCPTDTSTTAETWQASATYSNHMLKLQPSGTSYTIDLSSSRGPPIPEAGFSITGLQPTRSNSSSGVVTQQQNFMLLGGHTQTAFINMSQVALFSLPEESWSFLTIEDPTTSSTELATKSTFATSVDSRSGHTAVLTEDGSKVIVFGGWVGDITTAADPQFAVLEVGAGYGGSGDWAWDIPTVNGTGLVSGRGIYGHGATMLPGNIMMVVGGYTIPKASFKSKRATSNSQTYFFNATSMAWTDSYTNPSYLTSSGSTSSPTTSTLKAKQVGLGTGIGLGFAAVVGALIFYFYYSRRLKKQRHTERDRQLGSLSTTAARHYPIAHDAELAYTGYLMPSMAERSTSYAGGYESIQGGYGNREGSLDIDRAVSMPALNQSIRRNMHSSGAKGAYQAAPLFDGHIRTNSLGTAGPIHPIYETDEEDISYTIPEISPRQDDQDVTVTKEFKRKPVRLSYTDPFADPPALQLVESSTTERSASTPSPEILKDQAKDREREIESWVADWAAADALLNSQAHNASAGRLSPQKKGSQGASTDDSGRTNSNLSERSTTTGIVSRSMSQRSTSLSAFFTGGSKHLFSGSSSMAVSPTKEYAGVRGHAYHDSGSSSLTAAPSLLPTLTTDGDALLPPPEGDGSGTPSKLRRGGKHGGGWLVGSIRRALGGEGSPTRFHRSPSFSSRETSPTRPLTSGMANPGAQPRRTVSAGSAMWRRKQGRSDWEDSEGFEKRTGANVGLAGREKDVVEGGIGVAGTTEDEEWDIERAIENRVVQVMFTVPKEKLRVVNADEASDDEELDEKTTEPEACKVGMKEPIVTEAEVAPCPTVQKLQHEPQLEPQSELQPEPEPEPGFQPQPESQPQFRPGLQLEPQPEPQIHPELETRPQPQAKQEAQTSELKVPRARNRMPLKVSTRKSERELLRELQDDDSDGDSLSIQGTPERPKSRVQQMVARFENISPASSPSSS